MDETECEHACSGVKLSLKVNSCHFQKNERILTLTKNSQTQKGKSYAFVLCGISILKGH